MTKIDPETLSDIRGSLDVFNLSAPLTDEELALAGMMSALPGEVTSRLKSMPAVRDLDDVSDDSPIDAVAAVLDGTSYNIQYAHYLRCQALASLVAFEEGWKSFEELILKAYVVARRRENKEYKGDDPNKAFSLRIREQVAEDFIGFIQSVIFEAVNTPKPSLVTKR